MTSRPGTNSPGPEQEFVLPVDQDPSLSTPRGVADREILTMCGCIARGETPRTVLWGAILPYDLEYPPFKDGQGRSVSKILEIAGITRPSAYNEFTSVDQVLDALVEEGILRYDPVKSRVVSIECDLPLTGAEAFSAIRCAPG